MPRTPDLPPTIPLFPLSGAILMPRARLPLNIFEPRYLQMFEDALRSGNRLIGIVQPTGEGLSKVGTVGRIVAFSETDDGRMMISLKAVSRFALGEVEEGFTPYLRGRADWARYAGDRRATAEEDAGFDREAFVTRLKRYMKACDLSTDWSTTEEAGDEMLINALAMLLPFEPEEKQALLEAPTLTERRVMLDGLMNFALHAGTGEEKLQ